MRIFSKKAYRFDHPSGRDVGGSVFTQALSFHDVPDWVKESSMFKLAFEAGEIDLPESKDDESALEKNADNKSADVATLKELRAKAKELDIDGFNKMKKDDLLEAIEKASNQNPISEDENHDFKNSDEDVEDSNKSGE